MKLNSNCVTQKYIKLHDIFNSVVLTKIKRISLKANAIECQNQFAHFFPSFSSY